MASKSMLTLLNDTLQACYIEGTSVRESGLTVSTERLQGETILFFHIDSHEGRKSLSMLGEGLKVCDYLVFYTKEGENRETVCFVELKGKKLEEAIKQVLSTHERVVTLAEEKITLKRHQYTRKVCICLHGHVTRKNQRIEDLLKSVFGKDNICIKHGVKHFKLLGEFLRQKTT